MNVAEQALFKLRVDLARNPGGLNEAELDSLLAEVDAESDRNLAAAAEFFGLNLAELEERAGIMQYDDNMPRVTANHLALAEGLRRIMPEISAGLCKWIAQNFGDALEISRECDRSIGEVVRAMLKIDREQGYFHARNEDLAARKGKTGPDVRGGKPP